MNQPNVEMQVHKQPGVSVITIRGEVTGFAEEVLMNAYNEAGSDPSQTIILDFGELEYMNSSGIGLLVTLLILSLIHISEPTRPY